jgi:hypothetical protein
MVLLMGRPLFFRGAKSGSFDLSDEGQDYQKTDGDYHNFSLQRKSNIPNC